MGLKNHGAGSWTFIFDACLYDVTAWHDGARERTPLHSARGVLMCYKSGVSIDWKLRLLISPKAGDHLCGSSAAAVLCETEIPLTFWWKFMRMLSR